MKRNRKNRIIFRFLWLTVAFLTVLTALLLVQKYAPLDTENLPSPPDTSLQGTTTAPTDTETLGSVTDPEPSTPPIPDTDPAVQKQLAQILFSQETFSAEHMVVYDLTSATVLFEKNSEEKITAASTTKLLTALTMLDYTEEDTVFTVGSELSLVGSGSSTAHLKQGYKLTAEQILDALLIPSGNDAAYVIAAHIGRNLARDPQISDREAVDLFLVKMNEKAKSVGASNSLFTCPDGYPDKTQYTTASDMLKIAIAAAENKTLQKSVVKTYAEYKMNDGTVLEFITTNQLLLPSSPYYYEGTFGLKTGSTPAAGQCIIAGASAYGHDLLVALFKAPDNSSRWKDCRKAFDTAAESVKQAKESNHS